MKSKPSHPFAAKEIVPLARIEVELRAVQQKHGGLLQFQLLFVRFRKRLPHWVHTERQVLLSGVNYFFSSATIRIPVPLGQVKPLGATEKLVRGQI